MAGAAIGAGALIGAQRTIADEVQPSRKRGVGGTDPGPRNLLREQQDPDMVNPPPTDHGTLPNLRFTYADSHIRQEGGGWTRQITERELGVSKSIAGVNMRLNAGGVRELHWHKEADWAYMLYGAARINAIDAQGRNFVEDVGVGDLWYFPPGIPHAIQGLGPDGANPPITAGAHHPPPPSRRHASRRHASRTRHRGSKQARTASFLRSSAADLSANTFAPVSTTRTSTYRPQVRRAR